MTADSVVGAEVEVALGFFGVVDSDVRAALPSLQRVAVVEGDDVAVGIAGGVLRREGFEFSLDGIGLTRVQGAVPLDESCRSPDVALAVEIDLGIIGNGVPGLVLDAGGVHVGLLPVSGLASVSRALIPLSYVPGWDMASGEARNGYTFNTGRPWGADKNHSSALASARAGERRAGESGYERLGAHPNERGEGADEGDCRGDEDNLVASLLPVRLERVCHGEI